jgi:hypothetical protein
VTASEALEMRVYAKEDYNQTKERATINEIRSSEFSSISTIKESSRKRCADKKSFLKL